MIRSRRKKEFLDNLKGGISLLALVGLVLGIIEGISRVTANAYGAQGMKNVAVTTFVDGLNGTFCRFTAIGFVMVVFLSILYRLAPVAFRRITTILFLVLLLMAATSYGKIFGTWTADSNLFALIARRFLVVAVCLAAARIFQEALPLIGTLVRVGSLRLLLLPLFLLAAANSASYINFTKNFPRGQNVVLITLEGVRPDHLGCGGYNRPTSPNIDRLASKGMHLSATYSSSPRSRQSLATIHTGRYPYSTGVRKMWDTLNPGQTTLAEMLKDKGYETGAFVAFSGATDDATGFDQGFDRYYREQQGNSARLVNEALAWIDSHKKRPFFVWIHFSDARMPYSPPDEAGLFCDPSYTGDYESHFNCRPTAGCRVFNHIPLEESDLRRAIDLYDAEIRYIDRQFGKVLGLLEKSDRKHDSLILLIGACGESLGEHGYFFDHGEFLYNQSLQVPCIVSAPNLPIQVIDATSRTIDLLPTVLDILHFDQPSLIEGHSLMTMMERPNDTTAPPAFSETGISLLPFHNDRRPIQGLRGRLLAVILDEWKLIRTPAGENPEYELFNLKSDPGESVNLVEENAEKVAELSGLLTHWLADSPRPNEDTMTRPTD